MITCFIAIYPFIIKWLDRLHLFVEIKLSDKSYALTNKFY